MAIRFYIGGTEGMKNGTLISNGDGTAPIMFDGIYPGAAEVTISRTISIRADEDEEWLYINIGIDSTVKVNATAADNRIFFGNVSLDPGNVWGTTGPGQSIFVPYVGDLNRNFVVYARAKPTEVGSPDTSIRLVANGRRLV